jgi:hypothetical protein
MVGKGSQVAEASMPVRGNSVCGSVGLVDLRLYVVLLVLVAWD